MTAVFSRATYSVCAVSLGGRLMVLNNIILFNFLYRRRQSYGNPQSTEIPESLFHWEQWLLPAYYITNCTSSPCLIYSSRLLSLIRWDPLHKAPYPMKLPQSSFCQGEPHSVLSVVWITQTCHTPPFAASSMSRKADSLMMGIKEGSSLFCHVLIFNKHTKQSSTKLSHTSLTHIFHT